MDTAGLDVLRVVWDNLRAYAYSYELVPGDPRTLKSLRRQIRCLNCEFASQYRDWQVRGLLLEVYGEALWRLTGHGYPVRGQ